MPIFERNINMRNLTCTPLQIIKCVQYKMPLHNDKIFTQGISHKKKCAQEFNI